MKILLSEDSAQRAARRYSNVWIREESAEGGRRVASPLLAVIWAGSFVGGWSSTVGPCFSSSSVGATAELVAGALENDVGLCECWAQSKHKSSNAARLGEMPGVSAIRRRATGRHVITGPALRRHGRRHRCVPMQHRELDPDRMRRGYSTCGRGTEEVSRIDSTRPNGQFLVGRKGVIHGRYS